MKKTLLILSSLLVGFTGYSQYEGFENWTQQNTLILDDYRSSLNEGQAVAGSTSQSLDANMGNYSVRLETVLYMSDTVFGYFISGDPDNMTPGQQVTLNDVDSVIGYYKADIQPNDSVLFICATTFLSNPSGGGTYFLTQSQSNWTRFAFYIGAPVSDSLMIGAATGNPLADFRGIPGTWIQFDDIQLKSSTGVTQNILNNSFENWSTVTWDDLDNWQTFNQWAIGEPVMPVVKSTDAYSGNYAIELNVLLNSNGDTLWGAATNGFFGESYWGGGEPFTSSPVAVEFYYQYMPVGADTCNVSFEFKKTGFPSEWAGGGFFNTVPSYTLFTNPISLSNTPDTLMINLWTGRNIGSKLVVDDINFIYPVGVSELLIVEKLVAYPNPVKDVLNLRFELKADKKVIVNLIDVTGKQLSTFDFGHLNQGVYNQTFNTANFDSGIYFIEFVIDDEKMVERFIVQ
ncbi:MAG: T9SS type A sorting domain-containing protein [Bacteroidetes bacterium]|nr:T9SS type A sorting domain-containing protein [Bacteroidota bacterium]